MPQADPYSLPEDLFSADAVRAIDRFVIDQQGGDGFELMQAAAASVFRRLVHRWSDPGSILVLCGAGNNGGDGYLVAAAARRHGLAVQCLAVAPVDKLAGDARRAWQKASRDGVSVLDLQALSGAERDEMFASAGLIVDAMLGTGVEGAPREPFGEVIRRCQVTGAPVVAVDLPSGLNATTGAAAGDVIRADLTVTFIGLKAGLLTGQGPEACGDLCFESLGTGGEVEHAGQAPLAKRSDWMSLQAQLPRRPVTAHKGRFGHVLVVAGDRGFGGAGILAAEAAARSGAGLVTLATRPEHAAPALARCPSMMVQGVIHGSELAPLLGAADVIVCGPGIGQGAWGQQMLQQVVASGKPRVMDADALNLMASRVAVQDGGHILTPHPGEAARLLGCPVADIETDRLRAATKLRQVYGGTIVLKGAGTVVASAEHLPNIVSGSNPGMATGGMGDVLSGILGAFYGQFSDPGLAARMGVAVHLAAADQVASHKGYMGLLPMDVIDALPQVLAEAEQRRVNH
ncbi:NAD(P)H-hydrate dehydratase [Marinobacter sp.]|uniref:NAD(P)H-hydrate dehydratase n=1 Tax=Marinobacter sp. TaxID=50741 RepID=UPI0034A3BE61